MSIARVREALKPLGLDQFIMEFEVSSATVPLAAAAAGVPEAQIAKTLSFHGLEGSTILVVCAGDTRIDNPKFKAACGTKARMLSAAEAQERTGHMVGGVCPFALRTPVDVYLDISLQAFEHVYPAAGGDNTAVRFTPTSLRDVTGATWVDVCKVPDND